MTEKQRQNWNEYQRFYRKKNPDKTIKYRLNIAERLLTDHGFTVIKPDETPVIVSDLNERGE